MEDFKDKYVNDTVDELDCILFTGDRLQDDNEEIEKMLLVLKRWEDRLNELKREG